MVRKLRSNEHYWENRLPRREDLLIDIAKRKAHIVLRDSTFVYCEARFLVSKLDKQEVSSKSIEEEALIHSVNRYDSQGKAYLAKRAVDLMPIRDPALAGVVLERVTEELSRYSTRGAYIHAVADKMKELSKSDLVNRR